MKSALEALDRLLESELSPHLISVPGAERIIEEALVRNHTISKQAFEERGNSVQEIQQAFREALEHMERVLEAQMGTVHLSTIESLMQAANILWQQKPLTRQCRYLSASAARDVLARVPPEILMRVDASLVREDPLGALALTRFTESDAWQDAYLTELAALSADAFELRGPSYRVYDRQPLLQALTHSGRKLKPWSLSHCREAGVVSCITQDREKPPALPLLLFTALFYHYSFEIARAGESLARHATRQPETTGAHVAAIITSTRRTHSFLHPNIHSEALYWEDALAHMAKTFPALNLGPYLPLLAHGDFFDEHNHPPVSLNIVDHLWDAALEQKKEGGHRYHFQEALWSDVLRRLRRLSRDEATHAVLHSLELDDIAFTEQMFAKARPRTFTAHMKASLLSLTKRARRFVDKSQ